MGTYFVDLDLEQKNAETPARATPFSPSLPHHRPVSAPWGLGPKGPETGLELRHKAGRLRSGYALPTPACLASRGSGVLSLRGVNSFVG